MVDLLVMVGLLFKVVVGVLGVVALAAIQLHKTLGPMSVGALEFKCFQQPFLGRLKTLPLPLP